MPHLSPDPEVNHLMTGDNPGQFVMPTEVSHETLSILSHEARALIVGSMNLLGDEVGGVASPSYMYQHLVGHLPPEVNPDEYVGAYNTFGETVRRLADQGVLRHAEPNDPRGTARTFYELSPLGGYAGLAAGAPLTFSHETGVPLATVLSSRNGTRARPGVKPETDQTLVRLETLRHIADFDGQPLTTSDLNDLLGDAAPKHISMLSRMIRNIEHTGLITVELVENTGPVGSDLTFHADTEQTHAIQQLLRAGDVVMRPSLHALEDAQSDFEELISEPKTVAELLQTAKRGTAKGAKTHREIMAASLQASYKPGETFSTEQAAEALGLPLAHATLALRGLRACTNLHLASPDNGESWRL